MNRFKKIVIANLAIIIFFLYSIGTYAQDNAGSFLERGFGAKAAGMGGAYVTLSKDATSVFWNPANLVNLKSKNNISSMYTNRFNLDINYHFLIYAKKLSKEEGILDALGIGMVAVIIPDIYRTKRDENTNRITETLDSFNDNENALFLSGATKINNTLSIGTTLKLIQHKLDNSQAKGVSLDFGFLFKANKNIDLGLNLQNLVGGDIKWNTESKQKDKIPLNIKAGASLVLLDEKLLFATDINKRKNRKVMLNVGAEVRLIKQLILRAEVGQYGGKEEIKNGYSGGLTIRLDKFNINYAYNIHTLGDTHLISLDLGF